MSATYPCPACGAGAIPSTSPHIIRVQDRDLVIVDTRCFCHQCREFFYTPEQLQASRELIAGALRTPPARLPPCAIRRLREAYHVEAIDFGTMVGVSSSVVDRWEEGLEAPDEHIDTLLRLLEALLEA